LSQKLCIKNIKIVKRRKFVKSGHPAPKLPAIIMGVNWIIFLKWCGSGIWLVFLGGREPIYAKLNQSTHVQVAAKHLFVKHIFLCTRVARFFLEHDSKTEKSTKRTQNVPYDHKISQLSVKHSKWPSNMSTFSNPRPSKIYPNWNFWVENEPSANPIVDNAYNVTINLYKCHYKSHK
jgi:hypothetical protein